VLYLKEIVTIVLLLVVVGGTLTDIIMDHRAGASFGHLGIETLLVCASFALITLLGAGIWRQSRSNRHLREELAELSQARIQQSSPDLQAARHELGRVLRSQFETWQLTETEREVAMLLLKGLSFKEIAAIRSTLEKTVRQQASSIYRKSGVSGRHAFSAWFIEDYL